MKNLRETLAFNELNPFLLDFLFSHHLEAEKLWFSDIFRKAAFRRNRRLKLETTLKIETIIKADKIIRLYYKLVSNNKRRV